jgi:hypothetical protein
MPAHLGRRPLRIAVFSLLAAAFLGYAACGTYSRPRRW